MAKIRKVAIFILAGLMFFGICAMSAGCARGDKIVVLQQQMAELKDKVSEQTDKIAELEQENKNLKLEIYDEKFYSLQEAYDLKLLTDFHLDQIAKYHNNGKMPSRYLTDSEIESIKESAAYYARNDKYNPVPDAKPEDYDILKYYGKYYNRFAVILNNPYSGESGEEVDEWVTVGSTEFHYNNHYEIVIWQSQERIDKLENENEYLTNRVTELELQTLKICTLAKAYNLGLLSRNDLLNISYYHYGERLEIKEEGFVLVPKTPEVLSEETDVAIRKAYCRYVNQNSDKTIDDVYYSYYGTYNNCVAINIGWKIDGYYPDYDDPWYIDGVMFKHSSWYTIMVFIVD